MNSTSIEAAGDGQLAKNILYFARALREAGLPVGPGAVLDALAAVQSAGIGNREDFYATLHAVFVKKHEHSILFDQAFRIFWKRRGFLEKLIAMMSPMADLAKEKKPEAGASRITEAFFKTPRDTAKAAPTLELDARLTMSAAEVLQRKDFAQMSAAEIIAAREAIAKLRLPADEIKTRRLIANARGRRVDPRRSFRRSLKAGGSTIDLAFRAPALRHPPIVVLCDISGSMSEYTRIFLHFVHALGERRRVSTFLFGTRLTNVTRALRAKDVDEALALCSDQVKDWSGGTRIGAAVKRFNREWSRRVLGQGAIVLLFTDGLEREGAHELGLEMERLRKSCRRLIWANPLLRYDAFEAKAQGIRAMLPHVDEFRPVHTLANMADLCGALAADRVAASDPKEWLRLTA
ncbi:MAG TPA: VWA domain-containing protein [Roseiarcus sp.]|nr:VWA domain-containing protein [Roseiarcus sp.]